jgi:hypothetical protein
VICRHRRGFCAINAAGHTLCRELRIWLQNIQFKVRRLPVRFDHAHSNHAVVSPESEARMAPAATAETRHV